MGLGRQEWGQDAPGRTDSMNNGLVFDVKGAEIIAHCNKIAAEATARLSSMRDAKLFVAEPDTKKLADRAKAAGFYSAHLAADAVYRLTSADLVSLGLVPTNSAYFHDF